MVKHFRQWAVTLAVAMVATGVCAADGSGPGTPVISPVVAATPPSIFDGVFTEAQAERGKQRFAESCAICHGYTLKGSLFGPSISGSRFAKAWHDVPVGGLLDFARTRMPPGKIGTISPAVYRDIVAYILNKNGYPAGKAELPEDDDLLFEILIESSPQ